VALLFRWWVIGKFGSNADNFLLHGLHTKGALEVISHKHARAISLEQQTPVHLP
jgi:hypothetical protein